MGGNKIENQGCFSEDIGPSDFRFLFKRRRVHVATFRFGDNKLDLRA